MTVSVYCANCQVGAVTFKVIMMETESAPTGFMPVLIPTGQTCGCRDQIFENRTAAVAFDKLEFYLMEQNARPPVRTLYTQH